MKMYNFNNKIVNVFLYFFSFFTLIFIFIAFERYESNSENFDYLLILSIGIITFVGSLLLFYSKKFNPELKFGMLIFLIYTIYKSISTFEYALLKFEESLWAGFGKPVLIVTFLISLIIYDLLCSKKLIFLVIRFIVSLYLISSLLTSFWQDSTTLIDHYHSNFIFNEIMSIKNGNILFVDFIPQYQSLYTLLSKISHSNELDKIIDFILYTMYGASLFVVFLSIRIIKKTNINFDYFSSILLIMPFVLVAPPVLSRSGEMGTIAALITAYPIRVFPSLILIYIFVNLIKNLFPTDDFFNWKLVITSILVGLNIWNNFEFAIATLVTVYSLSIINLVDIYKFNLKRVIRFSSIFIPAIAIGFMLLPIIYNIFNYKINFSYLAWFALRFGSGFGAQRISIPGPAMYLIPLLFTLFLIHLYLLKKSDLFELDKNIIFNNSNIGLAFSLFSIIGLPYYLNRSYASGQLQIFLIFISISSAALLANVFYLLKDSDLELDIKSVKTKKYLANFIFSFILSIPIGALIISSSPFHELERINNTQKENVFINRPLNFTSQMNYKVVISEINTFINESNIDRNKVGYWGYIGEIVEFETGIKSTTLITGTDDVYQLEDAYNINCNNLRKFSKEFLIVELSAYSRNPTLVENLCQMYTLSNGSNIGDQILLFEKSN